MTFDPKRRVAMALPRSSTVRWYFPILMPVVRRVPSGLRLRKTNTRSPTVYSGLPKIHSRRVPERPPNSRRTMSPSGSVPKTISSGEMETYVLKWPCGSVVAVWILVISLMTAATDWAARSRGDMRTKVVAWAGWKALSSTLQQLNAAAQVLTVIGPPAVAELRAQAKNGSWSELELRER